MGECAPVYLAAVLEYLVAEVLEGAGLLAKKARDKTGNKRDKTMIIPKHLVVAVGGDEELSVLCRGAIMPGGGRYPALPVSGMLGLREDEKEKEKEEVKAKDPMFGQWIKLQNSLQNSLNNQSIEESFSEQVEAEYREERERRRRDRKQRAEAKQRGAAGLPGERMLGYLCPFTCLLKDSSIDWFFNYFCRFIHWPNVGSLAFTYCIY